MFRSFLALMVAAAVLGGCNKKNVKPEESETPQQATTGETNLPPKVGNTPIEFDPKGSDGGKISGLSTVYFDYDKAALSGDARKKLAQNAEWIKNNPTASLQIEGHTDERGSVEYNLSLGERRAKSVRDYLTSLGVDAKRLTIISYGEEKPIATGDSESAWGKNRRANFVPLVQ